MAKTMVNARIAHPGRLMKPKADRLSKPVAMKKPI